MKAWVLLLAAGCVLAGCGSDGESAGGSGGSGGSAGSGGAGGSGGSAGLGGAGGTGGSGEAWCAEECTETQYCAGESCEGEGTCEERPTTCPALFSPVCGCDETTYDNACEAARAGVRVDFEGRCPCSSNDECLQSEYCDQGTLCANGSGTCVARPQDCPAIFVPVCGCDGETYGNACEAAAAGVQVSAEEPCECELNEDCDPTEFCNAITCDGPGYCEVTPEAESCPVAEDSTRACDGVAYLNRCFTNASGVRAVENEAF